MSELGYCFVMMPFNNQFSGYYKKLFSPPIRQQRLKPIRVDEIYTPTQISTDIFKLIQEAEVVLADVTGKNPNVNYELGIAHALGKRAIIVTQNPDDIPFDYKHIRHIHYNTRIPDWEKNLKSSIRSAIAATLKQNSPPKVIQGADLISILGFLKNMQRDFAYEVSKESLIVCDEGGSCTINQEWDIRALTDVSHVIHELYIDKPGAIRSLAASDKTNGQAIDTVTIQANDKSLSYALLLPRLVRRGERLVLALSTYAENYISDLFENRKVTILHRGNTRNGVCFKKKVEKYIFPLNDTTKALQVKFNGAATKEASDIQVEKDKVIVSIDAEWDTAYDGMFSYDIIAN